jgi:hypothetical protein
MADEIESQSSDVEQALLQVDPNNRVELDRFERLDQAELACGLFHSNGIACELSSMPLHALPADIILWVNPKDAKEAWALLADGERESSQAGDQAAHPPQ